VTCQSCRVSWRAWRGDAAAVEAKAKMAASAEVVNCIIESIYDAIEEARVVLLFTAVVLCCGESMMVHKEFKSPKALLYTLSSSNTGSFIVVCKPHSHVHHVITSLVVSVEVTGQVYEM
jgi:hypothetical protein